MDILLKLEHSFPRKKNQKHNGTLGKGMSVSRNTLRTEENFYNCHVASKAHKKLIILEFIDSNCKNPENCELDEVAGKNACAVRETKILAKCDKTFSNKLRSTSKKKRIIIKEPNDGAPIFTAALSEDGNEAPALPKPSYKGKVYSPSLARKTESSVTKA